MNRFLCLIAFSSLCFANPENPIVIAGDAAISNPAKHALHIHAKDQTVIHWKNFSIEAHELTKFIQPSKNALVLNKIVGGDISKILGTLEANGKILLINPNGIIFGENALIETGGFIASTLDLQNGDFQGDLPFKGESEGKIINFGTIKAWDGDVTLLSRAIENFGHIEAEIGHVNLGVGQEILLKPEGEQRIYIRAHTFNEETGIHNLGTISAIQSELRADGNPYAYAIKQDGKIDALNLHGENGRVFLVAEGGVTLINGSITAPGGEVHILGEKVGALEKAKIDVSHPSGGGTIYFGGAEQGNDPKIYNATFATAHEGSIFLANATEKGDGGMVIFWANDATTVHSQIKAMGGPKGGNGGLIEVSGGKRLNFNTSYIDTTAPFGNTGTLLIDPDVQITFDGSGKKEHFDTTLFPNTYLPLEDSPDHLTLGFGTIITSLMTNNVVIQTNKPSSKIGGGVEFPSGLTQTYNSSNKLTIQTGGTSGIHWNGSLTNLGSGDIELISTGDGITMIPGATPALLQSGGSITLGRLDNPINGDLLLTSDYGRSSMINSIDGHIGIAVNGNIALASMSGDVTIQGANGVSMQSAGAFSLTGEFPAQIISERNGINLIAGTHFETSGNTLISSRTGTNIKAISDFISLNGTSIKGSSITMGAATTFDLDTNVAIHSSGGPTTLISGNHFTTQGSIKGQSVQITSTSGDVSLKGHGFITSSAGPIDIIAGSNLIIQDQFNITQTGQSGLTLTAVGTTPGENGDVILRNNAQIISKTAGVLVRGGTSVILEDEAKLSSMGLEGVAIVTDHLNPFSIGPGGFKMAPTSEINTQGFPIAIYTSHRSQNAVTNIGGTDIIPAPQFLNTTQEKWGIFFPTLAAVNSFTIFYKENGLIAIAPGVSVTQNTFDSILTSYIGPFTAELFRILHPYHEYISRSIQFMTGVREKESRKVVDKEKSFIRRPTFRHNTSPTMPETNHSDLSF